MKESRNHKIAIGKPGGTAGIGSKNYRISLPTSWMKEMGITEEVT